MHAISCVADAEAKAAADAARLATAAADLVFWASVGDDAKVHDLLEDHPDLDPNDAKNAEGVSALVLCCTRGDADDDAALKRVNCVRTLRRAGARRPARRVALRKETGRRAAPLGAAEGVRQGTASAASSHAAARRTPSTSSAS